MKPLLWISAIVLICGCAFFLFGKQGVYYPFRQLTKKTEEIAANRRIIDSLRLEIDKLTNDTTYIERMAREKLGMARPNEKVYKFIEKGK